MLASFARSLKLFPDCDLLQDATKYICNIELPGVKKEAIKLQKKNSKLTISAEKVNPFKDMKSSYRERDFGTYELTAQLPDDADIKKLTAALRDGVLTITVPKHKKETIEVTIE